jgi:hypothetical protein
MPEPTTSKQIESRTGTRAMLVRHVVDRFANLLTRKRIAAQSGVLAIVLWSAYAINLAIPGLLDRAGHVKGADFLHFYTAAQLLRAGRANELYDPTAHARLQTALLRESAGTYFVPMYGPQVYLMFEPLAALPYRLAALAWGLLNGVLYFGSCYALLRTCRYLRSQAHLVFLLAAAYPPFFSLVAFGQSSAPALVLFVVAFRALRSRHRFLAGLAIGSLVYKPQLALAGVTILVVAGEWKTISGAMTAAIAQLGFAWAYFGSGVMNRYLQTFLNLRNSEPFLEPKLYQMHSLRTFWSLLLPGRNLALTVYIVTSIIFLALGIKAWKKREDLRLRFAVLLLCTVLVAPHLWIYDLVIVAPVFLLVGEWMLEGSERRNVAVLLYACYVLPLLGPLAQFTRVQLSVVVFALMVLVLCKRDLSLLANAQP